MLLRPRQVIAQNKALTALKQGNALLVAPTGAGKTVILSFVIQEFLQGSAQRVLVLVHRDILLDQTQAVLEQVDSALRVSVVNAAQKDFSGQIILAMVPTLCRAGTLSQLPPIDLVVTDEAHHGAAETYRRIYEQAQEINPDCRMLGVTATPDRADRQGLGGALFGKVCDQITLVELIDSGNLVPPVGYVIDAENSHEAILAERNKSAQHRQAIDRGDDDSFLGSEPMLEHVVRHWQKHAAGRKTVVFCSTIRHAEDAVKAFQSAGIDTAVLHSEMEQHERDEALSRFQDGQAQVIANVGVLTEGWDYPPVDCVVLLRPSSHKHTMIQMIGRGLRALDARKYPGQIKTDCLVLDFGISLLQHHLSLMPSIRLFDGKKGERPTKNCPKCGFAVSIAATECSQCGFVWPEREQKAKPPRPVTVMQRVNLIIDKSRFLWQDLYDDDCVSLACGFASWAGVIRQREFWFAVGGLNRQECLKTGRPYQRCQLLHQGDRAMCLAAANDWQTANEASSNSHKTKVWLGLPPTQKQMDLLDRFQFACPPKNRYHASCQITYGLNFGEISALVDRAVAKLREKTSKPLTL